MGNWMSDAQRRLEQKRIQQEAAAQQKARQQATEDAPMVQELQYILNLLRVKQKLENIIRVSPQPVKKDEYVYKYREILEMPMIRFNDFYLNPNPACNTYLGGGFGFKYNVSHVPPRYLGIYTAYAYSYFFTVRATYGPLEITMRPKQIIIAMQDSTPGSLTLFQNVVLESINIGSDLHALTDEFDEKLVKWMHYHP